MLGDIIHATTGFAGILAGLAQVKQQPCQHGRTSQASSVISYSWAASRGGFVPQSWSDRFHRGVGLGALPFLLFPLTFLPLSLFIASPSLLGSPDPEPGRVFPFLMFLSVPLQGQPGPEGSPGAKGYPGRQVQYMASGSSVAMVMWRWPQVPRGRGRRWAGGQGAAPAGWTLRRGLSRGLDQGSLSLQAQDKAA